MIFPINRRTLALALFALSMLGCGGGGSGPLECGIAACDDGDPCTLDCLQGSDCINPVMSAGTVCEDGNQCTFGETCDEAGLCRGGEELEVEQNICQTCSCDPEKGVQCDWAGIGDFCDDGDCCQTGRYCDWCDPSDPNCEVGNMVCQGTPKDCGDSNTCTEDSCSCDDGDALCINDPLENGSACEFNENDCTEGDSCQEGSCTPGDPIDLNDNNPCTQDYCDKGEVIHKPLLEGSCNDGDECTLDDHCYLGTCVGGDLYECPLGQCASSVECITGEGCVEAPLPNGAPCDDGNACTTASTCDAEHQCIATQVKSCDDFNQCTLDSCDIDTGECSYMLLEGSCDDGNACTLNDQCKANGSCEGEVTVCEDDNPCMQTSCNAATGLCDLPVPNGTPCDDESLCNGAESCQAGSCTSSAPINCADVTNPCLQNSCNPETGLCDLQKPDGTGCEDGNQCTTSDTCTTGQCIPGGEVVCDQPACAGSVSCEPGQGCVPSWLPQGAQCDDDNPCTLGSACAEEHECKSTADKDCDDGNPCTLDSCDTATGECVNQIQTISCDDGSLCTTSDVCQEDGVCTGTPVDCSGVTALCIESECNPLTGSCDLPKADGTPCADGDLCNGDELCTAGECNTGSPIICESNTGLCKENICQPLTGICAEQVSVGCCGNSAVEEGENCDDGNTITEVCPYGETSCTVCDASCTQVAGEITQCGDGETNVASGEQCDDGNTLTEFCDYGALSCTVCSGACTLVDGETAYCGDTVIDVIDGEVCDDGNTDTETCSYGELSCTVCDSTCSFTPGLTSVCGDGVLDVGNGEACDDGNTLNGDCCSSICTVEIAGTLCRSAVDACDAIEECDGVSSVCPGDSLQPLVYECRAAAGDCDVAEYCTGTNAACPSDTKQPATLTCRPSAGVCDTQESCDGATNLCPPDQFVDASTVCRGQAGDCDVDEFCTGGSATCPIDAKVPAATVCRVAQGDCDLAEECNGVANGCPVDVFKAPTTVCRPLAGECDLAENCTGSSVSCPPDSKATSSQVCRVSAGSCDLVETCDGLSDICPVNSFKPSSTECRGLAGPCDTAENCTGLGASCPSDAKKPNTFTCRPSDGFCDVQEDCDGITNECPADQFKAASVVCRSLAGDCDAAENCTGSTAGCPADVKLPTTNVCRTSQGDCDQTEFCDGVTDSCPSDQLVSASVVCRPRIDVCDAAERCTGVSVSCPSDSKQADTVECRVQAGPCDASEYCDGVTDVCPSDVYLSAGFVCRSPINDCDVAEFCTGSALDCPGDIFVTAGIGCDDADPSTKNDACDGTGGCAGSPPICGDGEVDFGEDCDGPHCCGCTTSVPNPIGCLVPNTVADLEEDKLLPIDGANNDRFGHAIAMDGDTLIVGAEGADAPETGSGTVYVFVQNDGSWNELQKLVASDGHLSASFGHSLSIQGGTAVVGAQGAKHIDVASGAAYVFVRNEGTWTEVQKLVASDAAVSDRFGTSVLIHGDTIVVGAELETSGAGSAYIFKKDSEGVWIETQKIMASDAGGPDFFGHSLAMNDNTLVVGAVTDDDKGTSSGSASIFTLSAGVWVESQKITASDGSAGDRFGDSVTIGENTIVVGAHANADEGANTGAAYVYMNQGGVWNETQKLLADNATGGDWFGFSVYLDGEMLAIGAPYDDIDGAGSNAGSAYLYTRTGTVWNEYRNFDANDSTGGDLFSYSITLQNGTISLGARLDDDNGSGSGSAYIKVVTPDCSSPILCNCETGFTGADCGTPICGDGLLVGLEACDDGNTVAGDGCSPTCRLTFASPSTGYEMVFVPAGIFTMGCTPEMDVGDGCFEDESPAHTVILTNGFYIGATEVTQSQYETVMGSNPSNYPECGGNCPVDKVSWPDAILYANALSILDGLSPAYETTGSMLSFQATWNPEADGYRLLTEAEWEYAARAGEGTTYAGSNILNEVGWNINNASSTPHPVASLAPNANDLFDMSGNLSEWVWDRYEPNYYEISPLEDPLGWQVGTFPESRVHRGSSYVGIIGYDHKARLSARESLQINVISTNVGIRLARPFVLCGNGIQEPGETCDDGNTTSFDGCSATCVNENEANCQAILDAGLSVGDGIYTINPDGVGGLAPFEVYCDMTNDGGGWTLVLRGGANAGCRSSMMFGLATSLPPLDPIQLPISVLMFSKDTIEAIKTVGDSSTIGIRFTRDGAGSKFIPATCQIQFAPGTNDNTDCMTYTLSYSDTPTWSLGNVNGAADLGCANPLGTVGYSSNHIEAMGLYDCSVCFDAWGAGVALNGSIWVR